MVKIFPFTIRPTMSFILQPWQLLFVILASWVNREQQKTIGYFQTENQVMKEKFGKKRILLNDDQRQRLAVKGKILGRKRLEEIGTLFTPDTILRWHRTLVAQKWDYSERRKSVGWPRVEEEIVELVLPFARENPSWIGFRARWGIWATRCRIKRWATSSKNTVSNRLQYENGRRRGRPSSSRIKARMVSRKPITSDFPRSCLRKQNLWR